MMRAVDPKHAPELPKQQVQVNSKHVIIRRINEARRVDDVLAREAIAQVFDNALIQAGLVEDGREMVPRINKILERALGSFGGGSSAERIEVISEDPFTAPKSGLKEI